MTLAAKMLQAIIWVNRNEKRLPYNLSAGSDHHSCVCNPIIVHNIYRHKTNYKKKKCRQKFSEFHPCRKFQNAYW